MAWGTWRGWPDTDTLTPGQLTANIPYTSVYFPSNTMVPGAIKPTTFQTIQINARQRAQDVQEFPAGINTECFFTLDMRAAPIDLINPSFKLAPQLIQIDQVAKPSPDQFAQMEFSIGVSKDGTTIDYIMEGAPEVAIKCLVDGAWKSFVCGTTGDKAVSIPTLFGDGALSGIDFNFLTFEIERWATSPEDNFLNSVYCLGCGLQYKTDFNNIAEWPV